MSAQGRTTSKNTNEKITIIVALIGLFSAIAVAIIGIIPYLIDQEPSNSLSFQYQIRVQRLDNSAEIPNALIIIEVPGIAPIDEYSDSKGLARFVIDDSRNGKPARLTAQADGYERYMQNIDLIAESLPDIVRMSPAP